MQVNEGLNYTISLKDLFNKNFKRIEDSVGSLDGKMGKLNNTASKLSSGLAAYFSISAIKDFGSAVIDSLKNYEYFSASLRTLLHGDANAATLLNNQLVQLAKTSPFSLVDVQDSSKKLLAYGFAAKDVVETMTMLGDISSATGNQIGDVAYLYGTLRTQGVAMTKDLREFTNRGINLIPLLAKQFKIAEKDVYSFASEGKIGFKDIEKAFQSMTSSGGDFFNMMNEQSKTVGGRLSNMGDAWEQLKIKIGKSQEGIIASTVNMISSMINSLNRGMDAMNMIHNSFEQFGAKDFSMWEKYVVSPLSKAGMLFGMSPVKGGYAEAQQYSASLKDAYVDPSSESLSQAIKSQASLSNIIANMYRDTEARKDMTSFNRTVAILKGSLAEVQKNIAALKSPGFTEKAVNAESIDSLGSDTKKLSKSKSDTTEISGSRPQNIYITIQKQVENLTIATTNLKEGVTKAVDVLKQGLAESVNDINTIAR